MVVVGGRVRLVKEGGESGDLVFMSSHMCMECLLPVESHHSQ